MDDWKLPWQGGCRCGQVRFRITLAPLMTTVCHCTGCQRMTGSAFSLSVAVPSAGFEVTEGATLPGGLQTENDHQHCPFCKSWMFTRPGATDAFINVRSSMLDDGSWVVPYIETCAAEKLGWVTTPAKHSFDTFPEMTAWDGFMRDFQTEGQRPD